LVGTIIAAVFLRSAFTVLRQSIGALLTTSSIDAGQARTPFVIRLFRTKNQRTSNE